MLASFTEEVSLESIAQLCSQAVRDIHAMRLHEVSNYQRYQPARHYRGSRFESLNGFCRGIQFEFHTIYYKIRNK